MRESPGIDFPINDDSGIHLTFRRYQGYDQLNRIKEMRSYKCNGIFNSNSWLNKYADNNEYLSNFTYDFNGNIVSLFRNGNSSQPDMDDLAYKYELIDVYNPDLGKKNNRLLHIDDAISSSYNTDIDDQGTFDPNNPSNSNYGYDAIGNLIRDASEQIGEIEWNVYGKIKKITRTSGSLMPDLEFEYDATGNRIMKVVKPRGSGGVTLHDYWEHTFYVRDAQGNILATYTTKENEQDQLYLTEQPIYGSSRLGLATYDESLSLSGTGDDIKFDHLTGKKHYELTNHLGNVCAVVTDRKLPHVTGGVVDYYDAEVLSSSDYYPGGMLMPDRNHDADEYRFGFNGKENDNEVKGTGNQQDYGFRIYDPRVVRFLSVDPITNEYPELTPYQFASNRFIDGIDLEGKEWYSTTDQTGFIQSAPEGAYDDDPIKALLIDLSAIGLNWFTPLGVIDEAIVVLSDHNSSVNDKVEAAFDAITGTPLGVDKPGKVSPKTKPKIGVPNPTPKLIISKTEKVLTKSDGVSKGVIYKRVDKTGKQKDYIGKAKSEKRYEARQKEHQRANKNADYEFEIIDRGEEGKDLSQKEQKHLDDHGGPTNKSNQFGGTSNKRNVIRKK